MPCAGLLLLAMLALAAPAAATPVRMFAVGHKVRLDDGTTYQSFHDKMAALMDAGFPGRASLVQAGVDDVASHLFPADPAAPATVLVVFPEESDTGFRIVAPWIEPDPGIAHPALTLAERRAMLAADGARLLPGSGVACGGSLAVGVCENGYREAVVFADVDLPAGGTTAPVDPTLAPPPRFSAAVRVSGAQPPPGAPP